MQLPPLSSPLVYGRTTVTSWPMLLTRRRDLTLETGLFSRTRRTVDMAKIQDVTVQQSFGQRLLGVGDLMLESAGESGAIGIRNLDQPRVIADAIIAGSRRSPGASAPGRL